MATDPTSREKSDHVISTTVPTNQSQVGIDSGNPTQSAGTHGSPSVAGAGQRAPDSEPIAIDGAKEVSSAHSSYPSTADGTQIYSDTLHSANGVTITREHIAKSDADQFRNTVVIDTGSGDDKVNVSQRQDGSLDVDVNGQKFHVTLAPGQELGVRAGDGKDVITAATNVTVNMDVRGGNGNDTITTGQGNDRVDGGLGDDTITTRGGRDDVFGNSGNDTIDAGDGHDQMHGGDGNDVLRGGRGRDYLDGGQGNDVIDGGSGNDILVGGQGNDTLRSQGGNDTVYTGAGKDTVDNADGSDVVYGQKGEDTLAAAKGATNKEQQVDMSENVGSSITVQGSPEFVQRVQSDLDFLRSSPEGRGLLAQIDAAAVRNPANTVTIQELSNEHMASELGVSEVDGYLRTDAASGNVVAGPGTAAVIQYNPSSHSANFPVAAALLFHELSHAYNDVTGTMQPGRYISTGSHDPNHIDHGVNLSEFQVVGTPGAGMTFNFPGGNGPSTINPFTEKDLRSEMGLPQRPSYEFPANWDGGMDSPTVMAPAGIGGQSTVGNIDPILDRLLTAAQNGNIEDLRQLSGQMYQRDMPQFKEKGVDDLARQQNEASVAKLQEAKPLQIEQPEQQVAAGVQRR